jgi:hypothetical protein
MARDGGGIAQLLSYQVADDLTAGRLVRLLQAWERPPLLVHLLTKGRAHRAPKIDAFLDFAAKRLLALPVLHARRPGSGASMARSTTANAWATTWRSSSACRSPAW